MKKSNRHLFVIAGIGLAALGFLALIAYQNSEALSTVRERHLLKLLHEQVSRELAAAETSGASRERVLRESVVLSMEGMFGILVGDKGDVTAGSWGDNPDAAPIKADLIASLCSDVEPHLSSFSQGNERVVWFKAPIATGGDDLVIASVVQGDVWIDVLKNFIAPIAVATMVTVWVLVWLGLAMVGMHRAEATARRREEAARKESDAARDVAEKANLAKSDFLSMMSHELRTPLNSIIGFSQLMMLDDKIAAKEEHRVAAEQILQSGELLLNLINQMLDLSRIESSDLAVVVEDIDPDDLIETCANAVELMARDQGLLFRRPDKDSNPGTRVRGDPVRLKQVLLNLLSNSVKYNVTGTFLSVDWQVTDSGRVRFEVFDDGPGIPLEKQSGLFVPFNRLGMENREIQGTGIGLTICKRLVEAMDGEIGFESEAGQGATFWFEIPLAEAPRR